MEPVSVPASAPAPEPQYDVGFNPKTILVPVWCPPPVRGEEGVQCSPGWVAARGRTFGASAWGTISDKYSRVRSPGDVASALRVAVGSTSDAATAVYGLGAAWGAWARELVNTDPELYTWDVGAGSVPVPPLPTPTGVPPGAVGTFPPAAVAAMQRGKDTERAVAQLLGQYLAQAGCVPWVLPGEVFAGGVAHDPWPGSTTPRGVPAWVRISADGASPAPGGRVLFELKSRTAPWLPTDPPDVVPEYVLQVLTQLEATGATHGLLATAFVWRGSEDAVTHPRWPALAAEAGLSSLHCLRVDTITSGPAATAFLDKWLRIVGTAAAAVAGLPYRHDPPVGGVPLVLPEPQFDPRVQTRIRNGYYDLVRAHESGALSTSEFVAATGGVMMSREVQHGDKAAIKTASGPAPSITYAALFEHLHRVRVEQGFWEDVAALCAACVRPGLTDEVRAALAPQPGPCPVLFLPRHPHP